MKSDDHYGVSLAAIAVGVAPDGYAETPAARHGLSGIRRYLHAKPPPTRQLFASIEACELEFRIIAVLSFGFGTVLHSLRVGEGCNSS